MMKAEASRMETQTTIEKLETAKEIFKIVSAPYSTDISSEVKTEMKEVAKSCVAVMKKEMGNL